MKRIFPTVLFSLAFVVSAFAVDFYATPTGSGSTCSQASPCPLNTALTNHANMGSGDTLYLCGPDAVNTFFGKFQSTLDGGTVRSCPGKWAIIDGNFTTTLNGAITSGSTSLTLVDAGNVLVGGANEIWIDNEVISCFAKTGNTITSITRNAEGTVGGAASHSNGATVRLVANHQLNITGTNTIYRDFEVTSSLPNRTVIWQKMRGLGIVNIGTGNSLINLVIHDTISGMFTGSSSENTLLYGLVVYNNGMLTMAPYGDPPDEPRGVNLYFENAGGYSRVYDVLSLNAFTNGGQFYGVSGPYVGGDIQGLVQANSGSPIFGTYGIYYPNQIIGAAAQEIPSVSVTNSVFWHSLAADTGNLSVGYGAGTVEAFVTDNYFIGSRNGVDVGDVDDATVTGNIFWTDSDTYRHVITAGTGYTWNNNTYYSTAAGDFKFTTSIPKTFAQWKADTGYDAASTINSADLANTVIVRPNTYETGRANIIIITSTSPTSINVNLSTTGLTNGQGYVIRNAFNYFGSNVATGTYNSASPTISVPLNTAAATVATPTGLGYTPPTTCPAFCAMVVEPQTGTVKAQLGGTVKISGGSRLQ